MDREVKAKTSTRWHVSYFSHITCPCVIFHMHHIPYILHSPRVTLLHTISDWCDLKPCLPEQSQVQRISTFIWLVIFKSGIKLQTWMSSDFEHILGIPIIPSDICWRRVIYPLLSYFY